MGKVPLHIFREEELLNTVRSFLVLYHKSQKGFKEKGDVKNAWNGVTKILEYIQTSNYFYFKPFLFFETILFIWLNPFKPGIPNLYPQYHFIVFLDILRNFQFLYCEISNYIKWV